jgi:hypothetical protein
MPLPVAIGMMVGGQALGTAVSYVTQGAFAAHAASIAPNTYRVSLQAWYDDPAMRPSAQDLFYAVNTKQMHPETAKTFLLEDGIIWQPSQEQLDRRYGNPNENPGADALNARIQLEQNRARQRAELWEQVRKSKLVRPSVDMAVNLRSREHISDEEFTRLIEQAGGDAAVWNSVLPAFFVPLDTGELVAARNRNLIDDFQFDLGLKHLGFRKPRSRRIINSLREQLPSISDLIMFGVRDVWDQEAVDSRQLFADTPPQLTEWASQQGMFGKSGIFATIGGEIREMKWPEVYWAAHWQPMSPTIAQQAYHRLRPGRNERYADVGINVEPFTLEKLQLAFKIADYPVGDRATLAALAYQPLRLLDIRRALQIRTQRDNDPAFAATLPVDLSQRLDRVDRQWAINQLRDRGYHPDDAAISADLAIATAAATLNKQVKHFEDAQKTHALSAIITAYKVGSITKEQASESLVGNGVSPNKANDAIRISDLEVKTAIVKQGISKVRNDYFGGVLDKEQTRGALRVMELSAESINNYMALWETQRTRKRKTATTQQLLSWLEQGLIARDEVVSRLNNLGWTQADQLTLLREATLSVAKLQAKTLSAAQRSQIQRAKELQTVAKQSVAVRKQAIRDLRSTLPRLSLLSWLKKGIVSPAYVSSHLIAQAYPQEAITNWLREAMLNGTKPKKSQQSETQGAGPQG